MTQFGVQRVSGSSVLGETPQNRVEQLPTILYRELQPEDREQVQFIGDVDR